MAYGIVKLMEQTRYFGYKTTNSQKLFHCKNVADVLW